MAVRLGQYKAHYWTWSNSWEELNKVRPIHVALVVWCFSSLFYPPPCSSSHLISVKHTNPVTVGVIVKKGLIS